LPFPADRALPWRFGEALKTSNNMKQYTRYIRSLKREL
jgi:hypothetical protein